MRGKRSDWSFATMREVVLAHFSLASAIWSLAAVVREGALYLGEGRGGSREKGHQYILLAQRLERAAAWARKRGL